MKLIILGYIGLSLILCVTCINLSIGEREDGDVLVASRRLLRNGVPGKPMIARSGYNAVGLITAVYAVNARGSDANVTIVKGGPKTNNVVVLAISEPGAGIDVQLDIYAVLNEQATTPV